MAEPCWYDLDPAQVEGLACVICARSFLHRWTFSRVSVGWVPVGRSVTGSQVMACVGSCAEQAALPARQLRVPDEAWTAAGVAFLAALDGTTTGDSRDANPDELITSTVRAAAPLIVATELRRLATLYQPDLDPLRSFGERLHTEGISMVCAALVERADELDPAGCAR